MGKWGSGEPENLSLWAKHWVSGFFDFILSYLLSYLLTYFLIYLLTYLLPLIHMMFCFHFFFIDLLFIQRSPGIDDVGQHEGDKE